MSYASASFRAYATVLAAALAGCMQPGDALPGNRTAPLDAASHAFVIRNVHHRTYANFAVSSRTGDCVKIVDSTDVTIEAAQIGPCGGNGINVSGGGGVRIFDSYIHPETLSAGCCDRNDGVLLHDTRDVTVRGNVIAYGESNVEAPQHVSGLTVAGNFLLNPRGPFPRGQNVQAWHSSDVVVKDNYTLSRTDASAYEYPEDQEDSINFGIGSNFSALNNYVTGGRSPTGCGIIADDGANRVRFVGNRLVDTGECGIGIASGTHQLVEGNDVINRTPVIGGGNTALYVWNQYAGVACGPTMVSNNVATEVRAGGGQSGYWNGGGCGPVTLRHNLWNAAAEKRLTPVQAKLPPPFVPPEPVRCVVRSPYSTQTTRAACGPVRSESPG